MLPLCSLLLCLVLNLFLLLFSLNITHINPLIFANSLLILFFKLFIHLLWAEHAISFDEAQNFLFIFIELIFLSWLPLLITNNWNLKQEAICLALLALIGGEFLVYAPSFISFFLAIELLSLISFVLLGFDQTNIANTEIALKYLTFSAIISSSFLLFITNWISATNSIHFQFLFSRSFTEHQSFKSLCFAFLLLILFKFGISPLHFWVPQIYGTTNTTIVSFLATIFKFFFGLLLIKFLPLLVYDTHFGPIFENLIILCICLSLFVGAIGGQFQLKWSQLIAFSSIWNVGWILAGLVHPHFVYHPFGFFDHCQLNSFTFLLFFISISLSWWSIGFIIGQNRLRVHKQTLCAITTKINWIIDCSGLITLRPMVAIAFILILVQNIGLPPFAGFFIKLNILLTLLHSKFVFLALFALFASLGPTFYYLQLIHFIYYQTDHKVFNKIFIDFCLHFLTPQFGLLLAMATNFFFSLVFALICPTILFFS